MSDLPKSIQVIFNNNPMLERLIPNPVFISNSPLDYAFDQILKIHTIGTEKDTFYRVVFKKDSSRNLMNISSGELRGLSTTTCIERGKISDTAGLEKVNIDNTYWVVPALLGIGLYNSIYTKLSYISNLCSDIRNHQLIEEQSRFERVSETIVDTFRSIPDLAFDRSLRDIYLSRIVKCNDDCFEIYISQREQFKKLLKSEPEYHSTGLNAYIKENNINYYPSKFFEFDVLTHSVSSVFERLVAGRICEIITCSNYSDNNINRHKDFILRIKRELEALMNYRLTAFNNFIEEKQCEINNNFNLSDYEREELKSEINRQKCFLEKINARLDDLLDSKYNSFDILSHVMEQDEINILLIDGKVLISNPDLTSKKSLRDLDDRC